MAPCHNQVQKDIIKIEPRKSLACQLRESVGPFAAAETVRLVRNLATRVELISAVEPELAPSQ
jgi:hypothetical protein